jgi:hypothetical protein
MTATGSGCSRRCTGGSVRGSYLLCTLLCGCALEPNAVRLEGEHISHVSQHFGEDKTNCGTELVNAVAHWRLGNHGYLDVSEGYNLNKPDGQVCDGGICGPREVFQARVGYEITLRP